ncbi:uncharacterized protein LOC128953138 [Oppia nitens]|uniref:uncharacterized protein LOC128953138 n=1 Tax=Oppia nitens TaxID=1686743 RepID=UPI0023DB6EFA|nr:uncharacterized protein LOC128953138 [Oppia nitens]
MTTTESMANNNNKPPADPEIKELQNIDQIYLDALAIGGQVIIDNIGKFRIETSDDNQLTAAAVVLPVRKSLRNKQLLVAKTTVPPTTNQRDRTFECDDCRKKYRNLKNLNSHRCSATKLMPSKFRQIQPPESTLLPPMPAKRPLKPTTTTTTKKRPKSVISDTNNVDDSPERESQPDVVNISAAAANDTIAVNVLSDDDNNNDNTDAGNSVKPAINERSADKNRQKRFRCDYDGCQLSYVKSCSLLRHKRDKQHHRQQQQQQLTTIYGQIPAAAAAATDNQWPQYRSLLDKYTDDDDDDDDYDLPERPYKCDYDGCLLSYVKSYSLLRHKRDKQHYRQQQLTTTPSGQTPAAAAAATTTTTAIVDGRDVSANSSVVGHQLTTTPSGQTPAAATITTTAVVDGSDVTANDVMLDYKKHDDD